MIEYDKLEDLDVVAQGDVLEWVGDHKSTPWFVYGVVVTADCDLAKDKSDGTISYVPALKVDDFVWHYWRVENIELQRVTALNTVAKRISNWRAKNDPNSAELSVAAVENWLDRAGGEEMLEELGVSDKGQRNDLMRVIGPAEVLQECMRTEEPDFNLIKKAYCTFTPKAEENPSLFILALQKTWNTLPGDIFHLTTMPDGSDGDLFLLLRHIRQVNKNEVTARPDAVRSGAAKAKRIARITAPFRYAITQNLGKVFSDIGLPDEYDGRRKTTAQRFYDGRTQA